MMNKSHGGMKQFGSAGKPATRNPGGSRSRAEAARQRPRNEMGRFQKRDAKPDGRASGK